MELLRTNQSTVLLQFIPEIKSTIRHWQYVKVKVEAQAKDIDIEEIAQSLCELYRYKKGKLYICNNQEILILVRLGRDIDHHTVARKITESFPRYDVEVFVDNISKMGLLKLEFIIQGINKVKFSTESFESMRKKRDHHCIMVADDDMYIRSLVETALKFHGEIHSVADGKDVMDEYRKIAPDMIFLDIHLPGKTGPELLAEILSIDTQAFVIMLSADSSKVNVMQTQKQGAAGFITKPFDKTKLMEYVDLCPNLNNAPKP